MVKRKRVKFPRVLVSTARHVSLTRESRDRKMDIQDIAEEKFEIADELKKKTKIKSMPEATTVTDGAPVGHPLTFGEKAVGLTFNPGGNEQVTAIKGAYAAIIDQLNDMREVAKVNGEAGKIRHLEVAITDAETAQMRAVKGITWQD